MTDNLKHTAAIRHHNTKKCKNEFIYRWDAIMFAT